MTTSKVDEDPQAVDQKTKKYKYRNIEKYRKYRKKTIFIAGYCILKNLVYSKG